MHFASSLLRIFWATISFLKFLYGILLVLSRCCFHHLIENSILYKKDIQHFYIGPILYSENKIIWSVVSGKVDVQILSGTRSEKPKILFGTRDEKRKNLFGTKWQFRKIYLAVNGLSDTKSCKCSWYLLPTKLLKYHYCFNYVLKRYIILTPNLKFNIIVAYSYISYVRLCVTWWDSLTIWLRSLFI